MSDIQKDAIEESAGPVFQPDTVLPSQFFAVLREKAFVEAESLLMALNREIALSTGSACSSATLEPSYVLKALGQGDEIAHSSIRFGLGRFTTGAEVETVARRVTSEARRLRGLSVQYAMAHAG